MKKDLKILDKLVEEKLLNKKEKGDLVLYNYSDKCTYSRAWDENTIKSRGTIYNKNTGEVVAKSFSKFFNYGEYSLEKRKEILKWNDFIVAEKEDGSLGIVYFYKKWRVNTRGSFNSDKSIKGLEILKSKKLNLDTSLSYMVEIIYPENKIIMDYGDLEDLICLGIFKGEKELSHEEYLREAKRVGFNVPKFHSFKSIKEVLDYSISLPSHVEGFVVRHKNERVKFKSVEYLKLARIKRHITFNTFLEESFNGTVYPEYLYHIPEEFREDADRITIDIKKLFLKVVEKLNQDKLLIESNSKSLDNRDIGIFIKNNKNKLNYPGMYFRFRDGKISQEKLRRLIKDEK